MTKKEEEFYRLSCLRLQQKKKYKDIKKRRQYEQFSSTKQKVYDNCKMYSPAGELLCHCDRKKLEWYLKKNLAIKISDNPLQIILNFKPNKRGYEEVDNTDNYFYTVDRRN